MITANCRASIITSFSIINDNPKQIIIEGGFCSERRIEYAEDYMPIHNLALAGKGITSNDLERRLNM